jgi:hypothetical protein
MGGTTVAAKNSHAAKRKACVATADSQPTKGPNSRLQKERQPNWSSPEVMALIHAKKKEHEATKLTNDARDQMETSNVK